MACHAIKSSDCVGMFIGVLKLHDVNQSKGIESLRKLLQGNARTLLIKSADKDHKKFTILRFVVFFNC